MHVTVTFNEQQLGILNAALCELPYRVAAPLFAHLNAEVQKQFDAAKDAQSPCGAPGQIET